MSFGWILNHGTWFCARLTPPPKNKKLTQQPHIVSTNCHRAGLDIFLLILFLLVLCFGNDISSLMKLSIEMKITVAATERSTFANTSSILVTSHFFYYSNDGGKLIFHIPLSSGVWLFNRSHCTRLCFCSKLVLLSQQSTISKIFSLSSSSSSSSINGLLMDRSSTGVNCHGSIEASGAILIQTRWGSGLQFVYFQPITLII